MRIGKLSDLSEKQLKALRSAQSVLENSYNPYSRFHVGACLYGEVFVPGTNFENAAYGSTICAERAAVLAANNLKIRDFVGICITGRGCSSECEEPVTPCGSCRQVLFELSQVIGRDLEVISSNTHGTKILIATISELLPYGFGPLSLGVAVSEFRS